MTDWLSFIPTLALASLLVFLPGAVQARSVGLRGLAAIAAGPGFTLATVAIGAIVLSLSGITWGPMALGVVWLITLFIGVLAAAVFRRIWPSTSLKAPPMSLRSISQVTIPILLAFVVLALTLIRAIRSPDNFSQEYDNLFHMNAVRYIIDTGDASSLTIGGLTSGDSAPVFYPAAWHGFVSLVVEVSGVSIPVATNAVSFSMCLVWIVSVVFLACTLFGRTPLVAAVSAFLSVSFPAFPYQLFDWGPLFPLLAGLACLPTLLALSLEAFSLSSEIRHAQSYMPGVVTGALGVATGISFSHPSALVFGILLMSIAATAKCVSMVRRGQRTVRSSLLVIAPIWAVALIVWLKIRPAYGASAWVATETLGQAVGEVVTNSPMQLPSALLVSALVLVGVYKAWKDGWRWLVIAHIITSVMFVVGASRHEDGLRVFLTGVFYRDSHRLGALLVITALPLAVLGGSATVQWVVRRVIWARSSPHRRLLLNQVWFRPWSSHAAVITAVGLLTIVGFYMTQRGVVQGTVLGIRELYTYTSDSPVLNSDEKKILDEVSTLVPEDATIITDPTTGASFAYALTGRHVTAPHALYQPTAEVVLLNESLNDASKRIEVCKAVQDLDAYYVLDFGRVDIYSPVDHSGIRDLTEPFVQVLDQQGDARLLQIVGC